MEKIAQFSSESGTSNQNNQTHHKNSLRQFSFGNISNDMKIGNSLKGSL